MPKPSLAPLALLLSLTACGGSDPGNLTRDGYGALGRNDPRSALEAFEGALEAIAGDTDHGEYLRASLGAIEARIHLDPERARDDFLALAAALPSRLGDRDFATIGAKFANAKQALLAVDVLDAGSKVHTDSPALDGLKESILEEARRSGDEALTSKLAGLGYL